jgi:hypothetical protein
MQGVLHLLEFFHPHLSYARLSGALPCIRICIADVKVQMQMRMQGEWPCSNKVERLRFKVETPIHDNIWELVTWECKGHGVES